MIGTIMTDRRWSLDELESMVRKLFQEVFDVDEVGRDEDFFALGGDSLNAEALSAGILSQTGHEFQLAWLLKSGTPRLIAERLVSATPAEALNDKISVRIGGRHGRLLHFFHGDYNFGGMSVKEIADIVGPRQPILAIAPHGIGGEPVPATIKEMAADRLAAVRRAQPQGPYVLGGHCNGALVAFEVARLLTATGQRVDLVVMIDPLVVSARKGVRNFLSGVDSLQRLLGVSENARQNARVWSWRKLLKLERWAHRQRLKATGNHDKVLSRQARKEITAAEVARQREIRAQQAGSRPSPGDSPDSARGLGHIAVTRRYARAMAAYHPEPLDVPVLYFSLMHDGRAWKRISPRTELLEVPSGHFSFGEDSSPAAAKRLRERLEQLGAGSTQPAS
jgi:thioesterase domain-containing protein